MNFDRASIPILVPRLLVLCCAAFCAKAQEPPVRLRLGTAAGQTQFHIGEPIPVTLTFETAGSQRVPIATGVAPRRLRPQTPDEFSAEPAEGWVDPLKDLTWTMEGNGGNLLLSRPEAELAANHPVTVARTLNEFIVFRAPGHYVVSCNSSRSGANVKSNGLALDILPRDESAAARQFASARAILETGKPPTEPERIIYRDNENAQADAVRTLRYLDTEAAATYLASIYGQSRPTESDIAYALYSSGHREPVIRELERRMADSDLTLTQSFTITLIQLKAFLQAASAGRPLSKDEWAILDEAVNKRAFEVAPGKTPEARAGTYFYLFEIGSKTFRQSPEVRRLLLASLPYASPFQVEVLMSNSWGEIRSAGPTLAPILKQVVFRPWPQLSPNVAGLALLRLAELDPAAANEIARTALLSGQPAIADTQLLEFPIPDSAVVDQALLAQYRAGKPVDARIARFASAAIKDEIGRAYDQKHAADKPECASPLLAYFFRVDPDAARRRVESSRKAGLNACMAFQLYGLERSLMSPGLEAQLILDTKSPDPNLRQTACRTLSMAGSPAALPSLLQALEQDPGPMGDVLRAILQGRNWVLTEADYARLAKACAGTQSCSEVTRIQRESAPPYTVRLSEFYGHRGVWLSN
ncbi:MAG TPA: HEAT repeat domain-containing protein, partial [Bryobacteraceae bacterium]|nr:HEAT repeat domain-containing protein [Bryobacteraceae bacterium]